MAEFDERCPPSIMELLPDGKGSVWQEPQGAHGRRLVAVPGADVRRWQDRPRFEDWPVVAALWQRLPGQVGLRPMAPDPGTGTADAFDDVSAAPVACWRPHPPRIAAHSVTTESETGPNDLQSFSAGGEPGVGAAASITGAFAVAGGAVDEEAPIGAEPWEVQVESSAVGAGWPGHGCVSRSVKDLGEADGDRWAVGFAGDQGLWVVGEVLVDVAEPDALGGLCLGDGLNGLRPAEAGQ